MSDKRQRAIAKRLKRKPARDRRKAQARTEHNRQVRSDRRANRSFDDASDLMAPLAIALLATRTKQRRAR